MACTPIPITSLDDPRIDAYRNVRDRDLYGRWNAFVAESEMVIDRLLQHPTRLESLLLTPTRFEALRPRLTDLPLNVPVYVVDLELMCAIVGFHVHRGALAIGRRLDRAELSLDAVMAELAARATLRLLVAEGITNVDNIGGLFRLAAAFGYDAVVLDPSCCDPLYRKAVRVSMGHVLSVPYAVSQHWPDDLARLQNTWNITLIAAEVCPEAEPIWNVPTTDRLGIVVGSEAHGLSQAALRQCNCVGCIPMHRSVPSLNVVGAATAIAYEIARQDALGH